MKRTSTSKELPKWRVTKIGGSRSQELGDLRAKTAADAIQRYIREHEVDPHTQSRLAAYGVG
jgi:hypothetical protein